MNRIKVVEGFIALVFIYLSVYIVFSTLQGMITISFSIESIAISLTLMSLSIFISTILVIDLLFNSVLFHTLYTYISSYVMRLRARYRVAPYVVRLGRIEIKLNDPCSIIIAPVFIVDIIGGLLVMGLNMLLGFALIIWGTVFALYFTYRGLLIPSLYSVSIGKAVASRISRKIPWYVLLSRIGFLNKFSGLLYGFVSRKIYSLCLQAGYDWSSVELSLITRAVLNASIIGSIALSLPAIVFLGALGVLVTLLPFIVLGIMLLFFLIKALDRAKSVEEELPFLSLAGLLSTLSGLGLSFAFRKLSSSDFPAIRNENGFLERLSRRIDPVSALNELAKQHPSKVFREFLLGYVSVLLSGGDVVRYLEDRVRELFSIQGSLFRRYTSYVSDLLSASVFVFLFGPLLILLTAFVSPEKSIVFVLQLNMIIIPLVLVIMYIVIHGLQPRFRDLYSDLNGVAIAGVSGGLAAITTSLIGLPSYLVVGLTLLSMSIGYGVWFSFNHKRILIEERSLVRFIRDVIELRKVGYSVDRCIRELIAQSRYDPLFVEVLKDYLDGRYTARSWITRVVLRILRVAEESGSDLPAHLEIINRYVSEYMVHKFEVRSELRPKVILSYLVPFILAFTVYMVAGLVARYASMVSVPGFIISFNMPRELIDHARTAVILASAALSILVSKAVDGTIRNMLRASLAVALSILALQFMEPLAISFFG